MTNQQVETIFETARAAGSFETLTAALAHVGLDSALTSGGPYTVFAPGDDAFARLPEGAIDSLFAEPDRLAELLSYHLVPRTVPAAELERMTRAPTLHGEELLVTRNGAVRIDAAYITTPDLEASNGVIHVIDRVLIPASF